MKKTSIGLIELTSIAAGYQAADAMLKAAGVEIILSRSICSGKYMVLVGGDVGGVQAAVEAGTAAGHGCIIDTFVIANVHPDVFTAVGGSTTVELLQALGIVESFSVASLIEAADAAAKAASIQLIEIRLAMALGGKAFVSMTGEVSAVQAAVDAASAVVAEKGLLVNAVVIPAPRKELLSEIV